MSKESGKPTQIEFRRRLERAIRRDGRYPPEAFDFLHRGLSLAARRKYGTDESERPRHVSAAELCHTLRYLARKQWGLLARQVLRHWNIHRTRDFGEMVYLMIDLRIMGKQDSEDVADFDDVYSFRAAFESYRIKLDDSNGQDPPT
jgi:uncharacterized repeat protein (TIGR04138 family)